MNILPGPGFDDPSLVLKPFIWNKVSTCPQVFEGQPVCLRYDQFSSKNRLLFSMHLLLTFEVFAKLVLDCTLYPSYHKIQLFLARDRKIAHWLVYVQFHNNLNGIVSPEIQPEVSKLTLKCAFWYIWSIDSYTYSHSMAIFLFSGLCLLWSDPQMHWNSLLHDKGSIPREISEIITSIKSWFELEIDTYLTACCFKRNEILWQNIYFIIVKIFNFLNLIFISLPYLELRLATLHQLAF